MNSILFALLTMQHIIYLYKSKEDSRNTKIKPSTSKPMLLVFFFFFLKETDAPS